VVTGGERRAFEDLGLRVRELRLARRWTQEIASEHLQLDVRELQRVEAGEVNLTLRKLVRIARSFGISMRDLFDLPTTRAPRKPGRPRRPSVEVNANPSTRSREPKKKATRR